jgi:hypothetical protein
MVRLRRPPTPIAAPRRGSLGDVADTIIGEPVHNGPVERPRLRGEPLVRAVRNMASVGRSTDSIARELGIRSVDKVARLRRELGCASEFDGNVEAAPDEQPEPPEAA